MDGALDDRRRRLGADHREVQREAAMEKA